MQWVAPAEKNEANDLLEKRLWDAADQLRANSGLTSAQYSQPVLGLIFLRFADSRFKAHKTKVEKAGKTSRRGSRADDPAAYLAEGIVYLAVGARFEELLSYPEGGKGGKSLGQAINEAMRAIERDNPQLAGVLPKTYEVFESRTLAELLKVISTIPADLEGDAFGKIYEYFLGEFAMTEGQAGGEFFTPTAIVRLIVEILEPFHGQILDPACGSGGMFVQSARFVAEHRKNPSNEISIFGQEKVDATVRLCKMNLAAHGLEGDIKQAITYYDDLHKGTGKFDFVLANPPFNVNAVDKERLTAEVGPGKRFPFGLPRNDNANYLWIQLFCSALNNKGRAGFVMAGGAESAGGSEKEIRRQLLESQAVDVIIAVGPKLFYTVPLGCVLWFLDKGKKKTSRSDKVLFLDARHIFRQVDRAHRDWTAAQIGFMANLVRLYRGEELDFTLGGDEAATKLREIFGKKPKYEDVAGLCKVATLKQIETKSWSLNPGFFVGVALGEDVSDEDFKEQFGSFNGELESLNAKARDLEQTIARNAAEILET